MPALYGIGSFDCADRFLLLLNRYELHYLAVCRTGNGWAKLFDNTCMEIITWGKYYRIEFDVIEGGGYIPFTFDGWELEQGHYVFFRIFLNEQIDDSDESKLLGNILSRFDNEGAVTNITVHEMDNQS